LQRRKSPILKNSSKRKNKIPEGRESLGKDTLPKVAREDHSKDGVSELKTGA
jgi:hypothetical protein